MGCSSNHGEIGKEQQVAGRARAERIGFHGSARNLIKQWGRVSHHRLDFHAFARVATTAEGAQHVNRCLWNAEIEGLSDVVNFLKIFKGQFDQTEFEATCSLFDLGRHGEFTKR